MTAKPIFSLDDVTCRRGGRVLFQNFSLHLSAGDIIHVAGRNGAGKTSLLRLMAGALPAAAGNILRNGEFSYLPADDNASKVLETGRENLSFWARLSGGGDMNAALNLTGLSDIADRPVRYFSAGQKRRLSLARVYLEKRIIWLLDEPLNGLDDASVVGFTMALRAHAAAGGVAVIAGHHMIDGARQVVIA